MRAADAPAVREEAVISIFIVNALEKGIINF